MESAAVATNGTVAYVTGGYVNLAASNLSYRFDPVANTWTPLAPQPVALYDARSAYAANVNKVYVFGGIDGGGVVLNTTYIYDVATNTWTPGAPMPTARIWPEAAYFAGNGKIYVFGGLDSSFVEQSQTWEYDPVTNTWNTSRAPAPVGEGTSNSAVSGQFIYLMGGYGGGGGSTNHVRYDIVANTWSAMAPLPTANRMAASGNIGSKNYLYGGGNPSLRPDDPTRANENSSDAPDVTYTSTNIYDIATNTWSTGPLLNGLHSWTNGAAVGNRLLIVGGFNGGSADTNVVEVSTVACAGGSPTPTATATATATFTPTPTQTPSISGHVDYAVISKNVPNVAIAAAGSPPLNTVTNSSGNYVLSGFGPGAYTVTPSKTAQPCVGTPNGVFANDAALISQAVVFIITLNSDQLIAGNVSGHAPGPVTAQDAGFVAQKTVSICDVNNLSGQWRFAPPNVAHPSGVTGQLVENYRAFLLGDVSGDWDPLGAGPERPLPIFELPAIVSLPDVSANAGTNVTLPLRLDELQWVDVNAYQFDLTYDPSVISPADAAATITGTMSEGLNVVYNSSESGLLRVTVYGAIPAIGDGVYLDLHFKVTGNSGTSTPISIENFRLGDGSAAVKVKNSVLSVTSNE